MKSDLFHITMKEFNMEGEIPVDFEVESVLTILDLTITSEKTVSCYNQRKISIKQRHFDSTGRISCQLNVNPLQG